MHSVAYRDVKLTALFTHIAWDAAARVLFLPCDCM